MLATDHRSSYSSLNAAEPVVFNRERDAALFEMRCVANEKRHRDEIEASRAALARAGVPRERMYVLCLLRGAPERALNICALDEAACLERLVRTTRDKARECVRGDAYRFEVVDVAQTAALARHLAGTDAVACLQREAAHRAALEAFVAGGVPRDCVAVHCDASQRVTFALADETELWRALRLARQSPEARFEAFDLRDYIQ